MHLVNPNTPPLTTRVEPFYKIPFTAYELAFLEDLRFSIFFSVERHQNQRLEMYTYYVFLTSNRKKIERREDVKLKLSVAEILAIKRLLLTTPIKPGWTNESSSILFKLDQLTVGIQ